MLFLKNVYLKKYWYSGNKVLLLYLSVSLNQMLTGKVSIPNMTYDTYGLTNSSFGALFKTKKNTHTKQSDFSIFRMSRTATFF